MRWVPAQDEAGMPAKAASPGGGKILGGTVLLNTEQIRIAVASFAATLKGGQEGGHPSW